jgi:hypothetical protein
MKCKATNAGRNPGSRDSRDFRESRGHCWSQLRRVPACYRRVIGKRMERLPIGRCLEVAFGLDRLAARPFLRIAKTRSVKPGLTPAGSRRSSAELEQPLLYLQGFDP